MIRKSDYENYDYRQFWQGGSRAYEDASERIAIKKLLKNINPEGKIFADLGCGYGRLFNEYAGCRAVIMVDYSLNNLRNAKESILKYLNNDKEKMHDIFFIAADVNKLPFKNNIIDLAISVRVVHHLEKPGDFFYEVSRVVKPGGQFFVEFANKRNLKNILKFLAGKLKTSPFDKTPLQVGETILDYHPGYIKPLLGKSGFKIKKIISASNLRIPFLKSRFPLRLLLFFENIYQNIFSFIDTGPSIFLKAILGGSNDNSVAAYPSGINGSTAISAKNLFECPACRCGELEENSEKKLIGCTKCGKNYPVVDGIYVFKAD